MIPRAAIDERVREWGLSHQVVEKDYVLGWLLWGIGRHPVLGESWIFKGGTCLKKCYIETYRFSEDLDFTITKDGPVSPDEVEPLLVEVLDEVGQKSGIDFSGQAPRLKARRRPGSTEGRVYYRGPLNAPSVASVKLDLSATELLVRDPERRLIAHPYQPDESLPDPADVACYTFEEVFAEKIRAMGERSRPRDLYDIINLYRHDELRLRRDEVHAILADKCAHKGIEIPTLAGIEGSGLVPELQSEWENMLGHQLPVLPPLDQFWSELDELFHWLAGGAVTPAPAPYAPSANEDAGWAPPPTVGVWGARAPLEVIRFAAVNRLCVELDYQRSTRLIEPYSLRRTRDGNLIVHTLRHDSKEHRAYRVDRIQGARATTVPFTPKYAIEFSSAGPLATPPQTRRAATRTPRPRGATRSGPVYVIECPICRKRFERKARNLRLNAHKNQRGTPCPGEGRTGRLVGTRR